MVELYKYIMENVSSGKIDKKVAIEVLKRLKTAETGKNTEGNIAAKGDIAVIGMAVKLPKADSVGEFWDIIRNGRDCISHFPDNRRTDTDAIAKSMNKDPEDDLYSTGAFLDEIDKFDYSFFKLSPKEASLMDPNQSLLLQTAVNAIENAGYGGGKITGTRTGVYIGYSSDFGESYKTYAQWLENSSTGFTLTGNVRSILAGRISYTLDLKGPGIVVDTACSSALLAVHLACRGLRTGECDMAVAGGVKINLLPLKADANDKIGIESPSGRTRTFDDSSDGTGFGEGTAVVFLKPLNKALNDGDIIHAVIKGTAANQNGSSSSIAAPNSAAQEDVILKAWRDAGIEPETITYIEVHGIGTRLGDPIEVEGIRRAFEKYTQKKQFCGIGSVKTNIGHLDNTAGIAGLIKAILALKNRELPPSLHFIRPNRHIYFENSPVYICDRLTLWETDGIPRRCGVSSFGLSGTNCHVVLEEAPSRSETDVRRIQNTVPNILTISAMSEEALKTLIMQYREYLKGYSSCDDPYHLINSCYTANIGRGHYSFRLALIARNSADLADKLDRLLTSGIPGEDRAGIYYGWHRIAATAGSAKVNGEISLDKVKQISEKASSVIKDFVESGRCREEILSELCTLYVKGAAVPWEELYKGIGARKAEMPGYPFEKKRCWLTVPESMKGENIDRQRDVFHTIRWEKADMKSIAAHPRQGCTLVFSSSADFGPDIAEKVRESGGEAVLVEYGDGFYKIGDSKYFIGKAMDDFTCLVADLANREVSRVVYLSTSIGVGVPKTLSALNEILQRAVFGFFYLLKALFENEKKHKIDFLLVSQCVNEVTGREESLSPWHAALFGLGMVISKESRRFTCKCIDMDEKTAVGDILDELEQAETCNVIAYREGIRYAEMLEDVRLSDMDTNAVMIKNTGVYIITGGAGGIGLEMGRYLAGKAGVNLSGRDKIKLALINRSVFPPKEIWDALVEKGGKQAKQIGRIREIEAAGAVVELCKADVSHWGEMKETVDRLHEKYGRINGIIHCAGVAGNGFIVKKEEAAFREVFHPKVQGTWILDKLTEDDRPDFFVLFSSMESMIGRAGQGDYTAASVFLDAYASYRNKQGKSTLSINWPVWNEIGMAYDHGVVNDDKFLKVMGTSEAVQAFDKIINSSVRRIVPGGLNYRVINEQSGQVETIIPDIVKKYIMRKYGDEKKLPGKSSGEPVNNQPEVKIKGRDNGNYTRTEKQLAGIWGSLLGLEEVNVNDNFNNIGGNSLLAVKLEVELEEIGISIDTLDIDKYPALADLAAYLDREATGKSIGKSGAGAASEISALPQKAVQSVKTATKGLAPCEKALGGMEPFNDIYYKSCFYNSLFPVVKYFGKDVSAFLVNDIIAYTKESLKTIPFSAGYRSIKDENAILDQIGISAQAKKASEDIIRDITGSITRGNPSILWIDCYYEPIRTDTFQKKHLAHTWLVYGFNDMKRECSIMEHRHSDSLTYEKYILGYEDIVNSYKGFLNNLQSGMAEFPSYSEYYTDTIDKGSLSKSEKTGYLHIFADNYFRYRDVVLEGLEGLKPFLEYFSGLVTDENALSEHIEPLIDSINEVIKVKKVESFRARMVLAAKPDFARLMDEIAECWDSVRKRLARYMYTSDYKPESIGIAIKLVEKVYLLERNYHQMLFDDFIKF